MLDPIFDADALIETAADSCEREDLWGEGYREALDVLCRSIVSEAGLYPARAWRIARWLLELLETRGRIAATLEQHSEAIMARSICRPIVITGLPRTGTTLLHNLMAGLAGLRGYRPWEMRAVVPEPDAGPDWREEALADTRVELSGLYERAPEMLKIHRIDADAPDECHWLTRHSLASLIFGYTLNVPSYVRWLLARPRFEPYLEHRTQLQILAWRDDEGSRLVLKDPGHLWQLGELCETYPDALVVRLHRDPAEAVPSLCSLMHALQRMDSRCVDPRQLGPFVVDIVERGLAREAALRRERPQLDAQIMDLEYRELVADPIGTVAEICARAEHPFDEQGRAWVDGWLGRNPQNKAGRHVYTAATFGLDDDELRERLGARG